MSDDPQTEYQDVSARSQFAEMRCKELEVLSKEEEIKLLNSWKRIFSTQLTPILVTALLGILATQVNSYLTSRATLDAEREKSRSTLITKMVETSDADESARNLNFLLDARLIDDPRGKIRKLINAKKAPVISSGLELDGSTQAQILEILRKLRRDHAE